MFTEDSELNSVCIQILSEQNSFSYSKNDGLTVNTCLTMEVSQKNHWDK